MADLKYSKAMEKLEDIISKIENEEIDIDELSEKVREAAALVKVCKDKITKAEVEVKDIVESFDKE
ncbi:MAG: exodeoxyribonuclease VII small subunit [Candidatus Omnitrophica bacterium]|nr:exodeoxyribonuclease VII small subunit [Candidatus Omnitrophota bacterium]